MLTLKMVALYPSETFPTKGRCRNSEYRNRDIILLKSVALVTLNYIRKTKPVLVSVT